MLSVYDPSATKKPTNLSVNSDLLRKAKELNINLSQTLEQALVQIVKEKQQATWKESNQKAIENYNEAVAKGAVFSDGMRQF